MRGEDRWSEQLFSYVNLEARVPNKHPLRRILALADDALRSLSDEFSAIYALTGRSSIPPERLLRALLLQAFYTIRSERQLMEQLEYNLLFRWFIGLSVDDPVWDVTVFSKNRDRLLEADVSKKFLQALLAQPKVKALLSEEHFSVDGTLLEAWASMKSFVPRTVRASRLPGVIVTLNATSMARSAATTPTPQPLTRIAGCTERAKARNRSSATWAMR